MGKRNLVCLVLACGVFLSLVSLFRSSHLYLPRNVQDDATAAREPYRAPPDHALEHTSPDVPPRPAEQEHTPPASATPAPALTMIVLWSPHKRNEDYLPTFFASVGANPSIDLLLIKFDKYGYNNGECERRRAPGVPNVREVCLSMEEYVALHVAYFCEVWSCVEEERELVGAVMKERIPLDRVNSMYRPFRAAVFKKFLHPDLKLWGWCDLDMIFGSFERMFPWDIVHDFDVVFSGWPTHGNQPQHIFVPGHLAVFRNSPDVAAAFLQAHFLASYDDFVDLPDGLPSDAAEEGEFSHVLLMRTPLTFMRFPALADSMHHVDSLGGVFAIENAEDASRLHAADASSSSINSAIVAARRQILPLVSKRKSQPAQRTFSPQGVEGKVKLLSGSELPAEVNLWFPRRFGVVYHSTLSSSQSAQGRDARRYVLRRARGGPVTERFELERPISVARPGQDDELVATMQRGEQVGGTWLREGLYVHLQHEKYRKWWSMPDHPLREGEVMYFDTAHGAHLWDAEGASLWESRQTEGESW
ncbi:hypothetical protein PENSPDRAFT_685649 [Peniophora sp. CONT]|nr:hypothetical protein PENSPDRAFT_685649 [Peniophora sp. CONT]